MFGPIKCEQCPNREQSSLCLLTSDELASLEETKIHKQLKAGETLYSSEYKSTGIYFVLRGKLKVEMSDENGKTQLMQIICEGGMLGHRSLFADDGHLTSAVAIDDVEVCYVPKKTLFDLINVNPKIALELLNQISNECRELQARLQRTITHTATERIADALLYLKEKINRKPWTRKEIADWAGTTTETVIRTLAEFEREGLITQTGREIFITKKSNLEIKAKLIH